MVECTRTYLARMEDKFHLATREIFPRALGILGPFWVFLQVCAAAMATQANRTKARIVIIVQFLELE